MIGRLMEITSEKVDGWMDGWMQSATLKTPSFRVRARVATLFFYYYGRRVCVIV